jgi:hypothetical protein
MVYRTKWSQKQIYHQMPILYCIENFEILIIDTRMVCEKDDASPTLVQIRLIPIPWSSSVMREEKN